MAFKLGKRRALLRYAGRERKLDFDVPCRLLLPARHTIKILNRQVTANNPIRIASSSRARSRVNILVRRKHLHVLPICLWLLTGRMGFVTYRWSLKVRLLRKCGCCVMYHTVVYEGTRRVRVHNLYYKYCTTLSASPISNQNRNLSKKSTSLPSIESILWHKVYPSR